MTPSQELPCTTGVTIKKKKEKAEEGAGEEERRERRRRRSRRKITGENRAISSHNTEAIKSEETEAQRHS